MVYELHNSNKYTQKIDKNIKESNNKERYHEMKIHLIKAPI